MLSLSASGIPVTNLNVEYEDVCVLYSPSLLMLQPSGSNLFPLAAYLPQAIGSDGALTSTGCCKQTECTHCGLVEKVGVPNTSLGQYKIFHTGWLSTYCRLFLLLWSFYLIKALT